ncbi:MAG: glycoside hydrolase family 18 protein [Armatimonadetes bacterium]|nr:glycoside hydrolase family 18 protein [Armatimonadota bacterium]MDE2207214.1 glycoside hydrolase family 18 protein [Armatimonadota bacterium]
MSPNACGWAVACAGALSLCAVTRSTAAVAAHRPPKSWVAGYYVSWNQANGLFPPSEIDFSAISQVVHFSILPNADGSIDPVTCGITAAQSAALVTLAHAAHRKALVCLGGAGSAARIRPAISDASRQVFVQNLAQFVVSRGYDGLDLDMEPIRASDTADYTQFVIAMRKALNVAKHGLLLTAAVGDQPAMFAQLQRDFDEINVMTYDIAGPWHGWETWFNSPMTNGGRTFQSNGRPLPSVDSEVQTYLGAGVAPKKLGIGIAFYGAVWSGANGPNQPLTGVTVDNTVDYHDIMRLYYRPQAYHWDAQAEAPWLEVDAPQQADRKFISFDDERLIGLKFDYIRRYRLGGAIIWELSGGYRASQPAGMRNPLLHAVRRDWLNPEALKKRPSGP